MKNEISREHSALRFSAKTDFLAHLIRVHALVHICFHIRSENLNQKSTTVFNKTSEHITPSILDEICSIQRMDVRVSDKC
jgi:hypothetical protein